jgi:hypothetical protein
MKSIHRKPLNPFWSGLVWSGLVMPIIQNIFGVIVRGYEELWTSRKFFVHPLGGLMPMLAIVIILVSKVSG